MATKLLRCSVCDTAVAAMTIPEMSAGQSFAIKKMLGALPVTLPVNVLDMLDPAALSQAFDVKCIHCAEVEP